MMKKFYCQIIDKITRKTIVEFEEIEACDEWYAKRIGLVRFENLQKYVPSLRNISDTWYVDVIEI